MENVAASKIEKVNVPKEKTGNCEDCLGQQADGSCSLIRVVDKETRKIRNGLCSLANPDGTCEQFSKKSFWKRVTG